MRRIVIIALVLAIFVVGAIFLSHMLDERLGFRTAREAEQKVIAKIKPPSAELVASPRVTMPPPDSMPAPVNHLPYAAPPPPEEWIKLDANQRLANARGRLQPQLDAELANKGFKPGDAAFIRIFKESNELELWLRTAAGRPFGIFRNYRIAFYSGALGPKTKEGDMQTPEGFYSVPKSRLNPASSYHLAFNVGYPNEHDRSLNRTGSLIMVHGSDVSVGCFAMTDPLIEEIYLIVEDALNKGQTVVPVHVFPFRMTEDRMTKARMRGEEWLGFWENLKEGHDFFEAHKTPPAVSVESGKYSFRP